MKPPTSPTGGLPEGADPANQNTTGATTPKTPKPPKAKKPPKPPPPPKIKRTVVRFSLLQWAGAQEKELGLPIGLALKALPESFSDELRSALSAKPLSFEVLTLKRDELAAKLREAEAALVAAGNSGVTSKRLVDRLIETAEGIQRLAAPILPLTTDTATATDQPTS